MPWVRALRSRFDGDLPRLSLRWVIWPGQDDYGHNASQAFTVVRSLSVMVRSYLSLTSSCCVA